MSPGAQGNRVGQSRPPDAAEVRTHQASATGRSDPLPPCPQPRWPATDDPDDPADDDTHIQWGHRPSEVATEQPSIARVYDYYLRGASNFAADREFGMRAEAIIPELHDLAVYNELFLARAVRFCMASGVRQFIDIGCGISKAGSTHRIAHDADPGCRVVYVDNEAVAVESIRAAIADDARLGVVRADLREPDAVLSDPVTAKLVNFSEPVALIMGLVLHFVPDHDDPAGILAHYRAHVAAGSYLVVSHDTADGREEDMARFVALYEETNRPLIVRDHATLSMLLRDFHSVDPGIVHVPLWRPEPDDPPVDRPRRTCVYGAVARTEGLANPE